MSIEALSRNDMARIFIAIAALLGALSVMGGAFGAHALKGQLTEKALETFELGTRYQIDRKSVV